MNIIKRINDWIYWNNPFTKRWNKSYNPYYYWWKARKWFKRPKAHFICGEYSGYFGFPCRTDAYYIPKIHITGLGWKDKYDSPRHEWDPAIAFIFTSPFKTTVDSRFTTNGKFSYHKQYWIGFVFNWVNKHSDWKDDSHTSSRATWEAILDVLYYKKDPKNVWKCHIWKCGVGKDAYDITINANMKL